MKKYNAFSLPLMHLNVDEEAILAKAKHLGFFKRELSCRT